MGCIVIHLDHKGVHLEVRENGVGVYAVNVFWRGAGHLKYGSTKFLCVNQLLCQLLEYKYAVWLPFWTLVSLCTLLTFDILVWMLMSIPFFCKESKLWNALPLHLINSPDLSTFKEIICITYAYHTYIHMYDDIKFISLYINEINNPQKLQEYSLRVILYRAFSSPWKP